MAWRRPGDKPLSETMMVSSPTHICVTRPQWVNVIWAVQEIRYGTQSALYRVSENCNILFIVDHKGLLKLASSKWLTMCIASQVGEAVKRLTHYYLFQHSTISSNDKLICSRWFWFVESTDQHHTSIVTLTNRPFYIRHVELPYATDTVSLTTACGALWRQLQTHFVPRETSDQCTNMCCDSIVFFVVIPHVHFPVRKHVNNNIPKCHSYQCRLIVCVCF